MTEMTITESLTAMNMDWARETMPDVLNDNVRICRMHQLRYEGNDLDNYVRLSSYMWLELRGFRRLTGGELLPYGELPS